MIMLIAIIVSFFFGFALAVYFCEHNNKKALDGWGRSLDISKRMIAMNADVIYKR